MPRSGPEPGRARIHCAQARLLPRWMRRNGWVFFLLSSHYISQAKYFLPKKSGFAKNFFPFLSTSIAPPHKIDHHLVPGFVGNGASVSQGIIPAGQARG